MLLFHKLLKSLTDNFEMRNQLYLNYKNGNNGAPQIAKTYKLYFFMTISIYKIMV